MIAAAAVNAQMVIEIAKIYGVEITKERASYYKIDQKVISDLNTFIDVSKKIIQAQNLLSKRLNKLEAEGQLNTLKNIRNNGVLVVPNEDQLDKVDQLRNAGWNVRLD